MSKPPKPRVLVVDDEPAMLRAVSRLLHRQYEVTGVGSGRAALDRVDELHPALAIVDIGLPELNGFEVMRGLKARRPDLDVIIMTGNAEEPDSNLIRAIEQGAFYFIQKPFDRQVLLTLVQRCLELRRLRREKLHYLERLERELEEARRFQLSLLPPQRHAAPGLSLAARYVSCTQLAGDFYDYATDDEGGIAVVVADVVGHGASAAMLTSIVKTAFHSAQADRYEPHAVIDRVKEGMRVFDPSRFVTLACARIDPARRELRYVNAGHPPPILRGKTATALLEPTAPLVSSALYELPGTQESVPLAAGDVLLMYSDGVTEASNNEGLFGQERLIALVEANGLDFHGLLDRVLSEVSEFTRETKDDLTLLAVGVG